MSSNQTQAFKNAEHCESTVGQDQGRQPRHEALFDEVQRLRETLDLVDGFIHRIRSGDLEKTEAVSAASAAPPLHVPPFIEVMTETPGELAGMNQRLRAQLLELQELVF